MVTQQLESSLVLNGLLCVYRTHPITDVFCHDSYKQKTSYCHRA